MGPGLKVRGIEYAYEAMREFDSVKHPFILTGLKIAPGHHYGLEDEVFKQILIGSENRFSPDYWKFGIEVIKRAKAPGSVNLNTPIYVISQYERHNDPELPHAEKLSLDAGADRFFSRFENYKGVKLTDILDQIKYERFGK